MPETVRSGWPHRFAALVPVILCMLRSSEVYGQVVIENTPPTTTGGSFVNDVQWKAMLFTSGAGATRIDSLDLGLNPPSGGTPPGTWNVRVSLYTVSLGLPTSQIATMGLAPVSIVATTQMYTLTPPTTWLLAASTPYALVISSDGTGIRWSNRSGISPTASGGFSYDGFLTTGDSALSWTSEGLTTFNALRLSVAAVPELENGVLAMAVGLLVVAGIRSSQRCCQR